MMIFVKSFKILFNFEMVFIAIAAIIFLTHDDYNIRKQQLFVIFSVENFTRKL